MVTDAPCAGARPSVGGFRVLVVGGGASGVLLAAQILRRGGGQVAVTILEKGAMLGCGVAYATTDPQHLLNTRVANMSAYPDLPDHFLDWLRAEGHRPAEPEGFVPRPTYGRYMQALLDPWIHTPALSCRQAECLRLDVGPLGVTADLANGDRVQGDVAVLATGHALPGAADAPGLSQPWASSALPARGDVLLVGSGLTMVDQVLSLLARGHDGRITAISRRGLLPQVHRATTPVPVLREDLPNPMRIAALMLWLRRQARLREAQGGDWRDVADGLRPHLQAIWSELPLASRRSFLRHASPYWEVHRHRMPPASHERIREAQSDGRLRLLRGRFDRVDVADDGRLLARIVGARGERQTMPVAHVIDCRGVRRDPESHATPLVADLLASGVARIDPLRLGLDVAADCRVRGTDGIPGGRLFAMGPASRAAFWEITAIPDIRSQAAALAERILRDAPPSGLDPALPAMGPTPPRAPHPRRTSS